jgi:glycosyltransferase involved in cell wall biosynthesis
VEPFFSFKSRKNPLRAGKKFRYLWVGAPNTRKGWKEAIHVWERGGFHENRMAELYMKTTVMGRMEKLDNVILDARDVSRDELLRIYHRAHCFLFPTRGEGFGLTLAEAMRTGLPCISPAYSGVTDFFDDDVGYVVEHEVRESTLAAVGNPEGHRTRIGQPFADQLGETMLFVAENYEEALLKGRRAAERIRSRFTWGRSAEILIGHVLAEQMNTGRRPLGHD